MAKKKKNKKAKEKKVLRNQTKAIQRQIAIEQGFYNRANNRAHKDKSKYTRKNKHKKPPKDE